MVEQSVFSSVKRCVLKNGLTLLFLESRKHPVVSIRTDIGSGVLRETPLRAGLARLTGAMLQEGQEGLDAFALSRAVDSLGGILKTDTRGARIKLLAEDFQDGLELLAGCLLRPSFGEEALARLRARTLDAMKQAEENPARQASLAFDRLVYGKHPFHRPAEGTPETVSRIRRRDLVSLHRKLFVPSNALISICGDVDSDQVTKLVTRLFGGWKNRSVSPIPRFRVRRQKTVRRSWIPMDREQVHIYLGHLGIRRDDPSYPALRVLDSVLGAGSGFTDRISRDLRDEQGLAYTVYASICADAGRVPGTFRAYIGTDPGNAELAIQGILKHVKRIRKELASREELEIAIETVRGNYASSYETVSQKAGYMVFLERYGLPMDYPLRYLRAVGRLKVEELRSVAQRYLNEEHYSLSVAGPPSAGRST